MTGFGQATGENQRHAVTVTLRGVNHRFLEIRLRLDDEYRASEKEVRGRLQEELFRGRVDAAVEVRCLGERDVEVEVHRNVVQGAHTALHGLMEEGLIARELTAGDLLRLPEALSVRLVPDRWDDEDRALVLEVTERALSQLIDARSREGQRLAAVLAERVAVLEDLVRDLAGQREETLGEIAAGLEERLGRLLAGDHPDRPVEIDPTRLAQEVAILADKSDIQEELDRLGSHISHFREIVHLTGDRPTSVGKRLDFLLQEIFRELNTLGAKCRNAAMTRKVLEAKGVSEQLREQVQNLE